MSNLTLNTKTYSGSGFVNGLVSWIERSGVLLQLSRSFVPPSVWTPKVRGKSGSSGTWICPSWPLKALSVHAPVMSSARRTLL